MDTSTPVVVLAPGNHAGHGVARSLGRLGVRVYGVHGDDRSPAARSRYWHESLTWRLESAAPRESLDWLLRLAERVGGRPLLLATNDPSCLFVADHADALRERYRIPAQPPGLERALSSKARMYHLCREHEVPTPETVFPRSRAEMLGFLGQARFPVVLKPILNREGRQRAEMRIVIAEDAAALLRAYDEMETPEAPNLMLQEYIPGGPETIWMFNGYFDEHSQCRFGMTGRKLRQYPAYTGATSLGVCLPNDTVARRTVGLMRALGYRGVLDIGYKYDARTGGYYLLDVNPRVGATFRLFVDSAGMDVVRALYLDLTGQSIKRGLPRDGRRWVAEHADLLSSWRYLRDGRLTAGDWLRSFRGVEECSWFAPDDLAPLGAVLRQAATIGARRLLGRRASRKGTAAERSGVRAATIA